MGILDDAIREHLELRRSRGAETEEISEIQHEVLGALTPTIAEGLEAVPDDADVTAAEPVAAAAETAPEPAEPHAEAPEPDRHPEPVEQPTRQFTALEREAAEKPVSAAAPAAEDEVHDELEDTPEFLQETPEHDRLWFEQKPPKDFNF